MANENSFDALLAAVQRGSWTRRRVLKRAVALGLSAPAIATLLAACGGDDDDDTTGETEPTEAPGGGAGNEAEATPTTATEEEGGATPAGNGGEATQASGEGEGTPASEETPASGGEESGAGEGIRGGKLAVASIGEPSTLDEHQTTASVTAEIGYCMYETLFAYDENYQPIPMLADSYDVSEDGTTHTIKLREGVPFHNGEEMTSADVVASIERWGQISGVGKLLMEATEKLTAVDDYTVEFQTSKPYGTILVALCSNTQACVIYPASVLENASTDPLDTFVGTGPYKLTEWQPDRYIRFERFEDYAAVEGEPNGYAGHKYAYVDNIEFVPVTDEAARVSGMQAGDYHIAMQLGNDQYEVLQGDETLRVEILPPSNWDVFFLNWESPMMSQLKMRQAFQACLNHLPILQSSRGGGDFVKLDPSLMLKPTNWYSKAGGDLYNINDPDLAAQYLDEAGYDGTPVRFMCTQEYSYMYGAAIVAKQQMENAGFTVDLQVTDWATVLERRAQKDQWDIFVTGHGFVPDPSQITFVGQMNIYPGWWSDEDSLQLADELLSEPEFEKRFDIWEQIQTNAYEQVPAVKTGDSSNIAVWSMKVGGFTTQLQRGVPYWNVWLNEE